MPKWKARRRHQSKLDGFVTVRRKSQVSSSVVGETSSDEEASIKEEMDSEGEMDITSLPSTSRAPSSDIDLVSVRQESPEIQLEFLDQDIRHESITPPPLLFDDDQWEAANRRNLKRRASVEIEEVEDEDSPGTLPPSAQAVNEAQIGSIDLGIDPETGVECWEEELHDNLLPASEIRPWSVLRHQIQTCLTKKFKTYSPSQVNQLMILRNFATLRLRGVKKLEASQQIAIQWQDDVTGSATYMARRIRALAHHYQLYEELPVEKRGGYRSRSSLLRHEAVRGAARAWLTSQTIGSVTQQGNYPWPRNRAQSSSMHKDCSSLAVKAWMGEDHS
jgi:hypothetical protein